VETLELGLWHFDQLEKLMETLFHRTENLHKVEENIRRDGDVVPEKVAQQMLSCKEAVATSLLQIIIFHNDYWFVQSCKSINEKIPKKKGHSSTHSRKEHSMGWGSKLEAFQETPKQFTYWS
jgi:hypothetical protein